MADSKIEISSLFALFLVLLIISHYNSKKNREPISMSKKKTHRKPGTSSSGQTASAKKTNIDNRKSIKAKKRNTAPRPWLWYALGGAAILVVIAVVAYMLVQAEPAPVEVQLPASQAYEKYQSGAFFLDVRSQAEWDEIHIPNSTLIALDELPARLSELPTDNEIVAVCLVGKRSQEGQKILAEAGISRMCTAWMVESRNGRLLATRPKEIAEKYIGRRKILNFTTNRRTR